MPRTRLLVRPALVAGLLTLAGTAGAAAQALSIDEGVLHLHTGDRRIGTETFSIRQSGRGENAVTIAQGRVVLDTADIDQGINASLELVGAALRPSAYQVTVRGAEPQRIAGRLVGRRFSAKILSPTGEQMREYLADDGAVVVDDGMAHHHYFLARRVSEGAIDVPVIVPRRSRQLRARVSDEGTETVRVGNRSIEARRLTIRLEDEPVRHLWVDDRNRVLRLSVPARDFTAVRAAPPD